MRFVSRIRQLLLIAGLLLIGIYLAAYVHREVLSRAQLSQFHRSRTEVPVVPVEPPKAPLAEPSNKPDFSLWSEKRIAEFEESLGHKIDPPLALLHISKVQLEVPVLEGTDDLTLNRAVGHIEGTARPGEEGNIGIAGHRDGFFRVLKDVGPGDTIELITSLRTVRFTVDRVVLVRPDDVSVLRPRSTPSLTLVTCYPFYFIGSAPQRYIVQASLTDSDRTESENRDNQNQNAAVFRK
jgi:sortase A